MAKYDDVFPDTKEIFDEVLTLMDLDNFINVLILADNRQKEIGKVMKSNPILKYKTGDDVVVVINEVIFELLDDQLKRITAETIMAGVHWNGEKDKLELKKPDFSIHTGVLKKYGADVCINLHEVIAAAFAQKQEQEAEAEA